MSGEGKLNSDHTSVQELLSNVTALRYFVMSLLPDPTQAQDVVQETFITITARPRTMRKAPTSGPGPTPSLALRFWKFLRNRSVKLTVYQRQRLISWQVKQKKLILKILRQKR